MRLGVIDCGTNTFHLLIAEPQDDGTFLTIRKERQYVRLGQEGLHHIGEAPFQRGITCIGAFKKMLEEHGVKESRAFGTEALRRAANGGKFIEAVAAKTGISIQMISGDEEARLIHLGVKQAVPAFPGKALIMDIGGGSVEFIIASEEQVFWSQSFPIGVQVLFSRFQKNDPISQGDVMSLHYHFEEMLQPLIKVLKQHETPLLFGASGSFEVIEDLLIKEKHHPLYSIVPADSYYLLHGKMLKTSLAERHKMPGLPVERAELIVVAFALIDFVIKTAGIRQIVTSAYAMKEGILFEMMSDE